MSSQTCNRTHSCQNYPIAFHDHYRHICLKVRPQGDQVQRPNAGLTTSDSWLASAPAVPSI